MSRDGSDLPIEVLRKLGRKSYWSRLKKSYMSAFEQRMPLSWFTLTLTAAG
jgi:hypothetical protein